MKTKWYKLRDVEYSTNFKFFKENQIDIVTSGEVMYYSSKLENYIFLIDKRRNDENEIEQRLDKIFSDLIYGKHGKGDFVD